MTPATTTTTRPCFDRDPVIAPLAESRLAIAAILGVLRQDAGAAPSREVSLGIAHIETGLLWLREAAELADVADVADDNARGPAHDTGEHDPAATIAARGESDHDLRRT